MVLLLVTTAGSNERLPAHPISGLRNQSEAFDRAAKSALPKALVLRSACIPLRLALKNGSYRKLTDLKWLNLFEITFRDKNRQTRSWQVVSRQQVPKCVTGQFDSPEAVVICAVHAPTGKIVVIREYRVALAGDQYGFPAGLVDAGETAEEGARREMKEETGLTITRFLKIGPSIYSSPGMTDESACMVFAECEGQVSTDGSEGTEQIEVLLLSRQELTDLTRDPACRFDAKAWLVMMLITAQNPLVDLF